MEYELLKIGDKAPDFSLPDHEGNLHSLSDFNNNIIMWFFPKANTPGWIIEGKGFRDEFPKFKDKEYSIIGVSADFPAKQKKFVEKFNFPFECNKLSILILLSLRIKFIVVPASSRSNRKPFLITAINPLFFTLLPRFISVVRFFIENLLVKLIKASDIFPENL